MTPASIGGKQLIQEKRRRIALKKLSCFLLLVAGISLQTAAAVPTGVPGTDTNAGVDYYLGTGTKTYEKVSTEYVAEKSAEDGQIEVAVPTKVPGTDTNAEEDYNVIAFSSNKSVKALYHGAQVGKGIY